MPVLELPVDEVHVWRATLERPPAVVERMRCLLADDERRRADTLRFERDRVRYTVGRALLRGLLARYTRVPPQALEFQYGEFDKPSLPGGPSFNLAHSGPVALYAFTANGEIGVDIELEGKEREGERIAERFFSPAGVGVLRSLPPGRRPRAFLACWTRKEAFVKARGDGLSRALDSFDVTLAPDAPPALLRTAWCGEEPGRWQMEDLSDARCGYVAALALRGKAGSVVRRQISDTSTLDTIEGATPGQERKE
jgi:4'-phosphopantetheinyl transferase